MSAPFPIACVSIAPAEQPLLFDPRMANRHGIIAGATGTGKTVTLRLLAESFSRIGVPVFMADVKGDLAGLSQPAERSPKLDERLKKLQLDGSFSPEAFPVTFWDVFGERGHPVRATISDLGPLLLSRLLELNETQTGLLQLVFRVADSHSLPLLDLKDLRALLQHVSENARELSSEFGAISGTSVNVIQRQLLNLGEQGADIFFGEPALNIDDLLQTIEGKGMINILASDKLLEHPAIYSTFLLWLLAEFYEQLPEVGDVDKPKLVFFFDEAHLLFDEASKALHDKIEQVVRLIRSKGVGVYFVTQNPLDIPEDVAGQLGNRIQHSMRAFTQRDQKAVRAIAETFRINEKLDVKTAITELAVGEALISLLDGQGIPSPVERVWIYPPTSKLGAITDAERKQIITTSASAGVYETVVDRESAYELLKKKAEKTHVEEEQAQEQEDGAPKQKAGSQRQGFVEAFLKSTLRTVGTLFAREIFRGILGTMKSSTGRKR